MASLLLVAPAIEPVPLSEAKSFLRVEHGDDDAIIASLIASARGQIKALTRRALITQTWRYVCDAWPIDGRLRLRMGPLQGLTAARMFDSANAAHAIDVNRFVIDTAANVIGARGSLSPLSGRAIAGIELDVVLGFGPTASDVPSVLRHAIRVLVAHWYENRGLAAIGQSIALMPGSVNAMIAAHRMVSL